MGRREREPEPELIHELAPYGSDAQFVALVAPFVAAGLDAGEPVLVVTSPHNIELLRAELGPPGDAVEYPEARSWYRAPARTLSALNTRLNGGHGRIRVVGEPVREGRSAAELVEWQRLEAVVNVAFAESPLAMMCAYATADGNGAVGQAMRSHPWIAGPNGGSRSAAYVDPLRLDAECNAEPLADPTGSVHTLQFRGDRLAALRAFVSDCASHAGLSDERLAELVLAANEMATNVVRHGGGTGLIRVWCADGELFCEIVDEGGVFTDPFVGYLPPDPTSEHGWGLWVTRQLCDLVEVRCANPGVTVRLRMSVDAGPVG